MSSVQAFDKFRRKKKSIRLKMCNCCIDSLYDRGVLLLFVVKYVHVLLSYSGMWGSYLGASV